MNWPTNSIPVEVKTGGLSCTRGLVDRETRGVRASEVVAQQDSRPRPTHGRGMDDRKDSLPRFGSDGKKGNK
jgi:hypothetical protein